MAMITLDIAQQHLEAWLQADIALARAKSYMVTTPNGSTQVTRADLADVKKQIAYWQTQVNILTDNTERSRFSKAQFTE
jgi:hypothetical protein